MADERAIRALGKISAMQTFVEYFPMSILDYRGGAAYRSLFQFLIDILNACGVNTEEIITTLTDKIFGIKESIGLTANATIDTIYTKIDSINESEQSKFMETLEIGIKDILLALLSSIFSCSAIPIIPNKNLDRGISEETDPRFMDYMDNPQFEELPIYIPWKLVDFLDHLAANPFSNEGKLYYAINGCDKYYHKVERTTVHTDDAIAVQYKVPKYDKYCSVYMEFGGNHNIYKNHWNESGVSDEIVFKLSDEVDKPLKFTVTYIDEDSSMKTWENTIEAGRWKSEVFKIRPKEQFVSIVQITINDEGYKILADDVSETLVSFDKGKSEEVLSFWREIDNYSLEDGITWLSDRDKYNFESVEPSPLNEVTITNYVYEPVEGPIKDAVRVSVIPSQVEDRSPEYIVCYEGFDPNTIYRTNDMNAFLWYIKNRSSDEPQREENKNVWDSRVTLAKKGLERKDAKNWNKWLNSKGGEYNEFKTEGIEPPISDTDLYPILHFYKTNTGIGVSFPAQRYFKPTREEDDDDNVYRHLRLNSTLYKFNYDYLNNIQILHPKVILTRMLDSLLNGALLSFLNVRLNLTRKETETLLSTAIKKYIEATDAEVEDCYFKFSNEEFDTMMQDMLLSRYRATYAGGEVNRATQHDMESYMAQINGINLNASAAGETTKITKLLADVSASDGKEGTISYGIELSSNDNWWKELIMAMALPIIESIFSPQVMLLFLMNLHMMGITSMDDILGTDQSEIIKLITNKIFAMIRSIILFIKDKIAEVLFELFKTRVLPLFERYQLELYREQMYYWRETLAAALACIRGLKGFRFNIRRPIGQIDEVDYADIINNQNIPESNEGC